MTTPLDPKDPLLDITDEEKAKLPAAGTHGNKSAYFTTNGLAITEDGRLTRSKYLNVLTNTLDDYSDVIMTKEEAARVRLTIFNLKHGSTAAIPVICTGPHCPWAARCVYQQMNKAPLGRQCLVELNLMKQWQLNYYEEYEIDPDNFTEMTLVNELVEVEVHLYRCNLSLALDPQQAVGVVDVNIGVDHHGNPITQKQISQLMELREKLLARKHRLFKLMVGDRQEKYKKEAALKEKEISDPSSTMAVLREKMESLSRELGKAAAVGALQAGIVQGQLLEKSEVSESGEKKPGREAAPLSPDDLPDEDESQ